MTSDTLYLLLQLLFGATLILTTAFFVTLLARKLSASFRHAVWAFAMLGVLLLPLVSPLLPRYPLVLAEPVLEIPEEITYNNAPGFADFQPVSNPGTAGVSPASEQQGHPLHRDFSHSNAGGTPTPQSFLAGAGETPAVPGVGETPSFQNILFTLWIIVAVLRLARLMVSRFYARKILKQSYPFENRFSEWSQRICRKIGIAKPVPVLKNRGMCVPFVVGIFRPVIILPEESGHWEPKELETVLTHELAHIARHDMAWQTVAQIVSILYWFHPLVWFGMWRMRVERELACDDAVLYHGSDPAQYANVLLELAAGLGLRQSQGAKARTIPACAIAMARRSVVRQRIESILNPNRDRKPLGRSRLILLGMFTFLTVGLLATVVPYEVQKPTEPENSVVAVEQEIQAEETDDEQDKQFSGRVVDKNGNAIAEATVCVSEFRKKVAETKTDAEGRFQLSTPQAAKHQFLYSFKEGEGFDFFRIDGDESQKNSYTLTFQGVNPVRIRFVDQDDKPLAGRGLDSWIITKGDEQFNTAEANERRFVAKSDEQGYVHFPCLPAGYRVTFMEDWTDEQGRMSEKMFFENPYWHPARDIVYDPTQTGDEIVIKLAPTIKISGKVQFADGRPASRIPMALYGRGFTPCDISCNPGPTRADFERLGCFTDKDGKYCMTLYSDMLYIFGPGSKNIDGTWYGAAPKRDVVSKIGSVYENVDFTYKPCTKVTGQIVENGKPMAGKTLYFYRYSVHSNDLPPEKQLENRSVLKDGIKHPIFDYFNQKYSLETDSQGRFEISLPPGIHTIVQESDGRLADRGDLRSGAASLPHLLEFELDGEPEKNLGTITIDYVNGVNEESAESKKKDIRIFGTVLDLDGRPVKGVSIRRFGGPNAKKIGPVVTDENGKFSFFSEEINPEPLRTGLGPSLYAEKTYTETEYRLMNPNLAANHGYRWIETSVVLSGTRYYHVEAPAYAKGEMEINLVVKPARQLTGTVRDAEDNPVSDATVETVHIYDVLTQTKTNEKGEFALSFPGDITLQEIRAKKEFVGTGKIKITESTASLAGPIAYGGGKADEARSNGPFAFRLFPDEERTITKPLPIPPQVVAADVAEKSTDSQKNEHISGRVVNEDGQPVVGVNIRIEPTRFPFTYDKEYLETDKDGRFKISCSGKGDVLLRPFAGDYAGRAMIVDKRGDIGDIVVRRGIRPTVRVFDFDGKPVPNTRVVLWQNNTSLAEYREGQTDTEGRFTFQPVMPDEKDAYLIGAYPLDDEQAGGLRTDVSDPRPRAAFVDKWVKIHADTTEFELRPVEVVSVTIRLPEFDATLYRPHFNRGPDSGIPPFDGWGSWGSWFNQWKSLGDGVYRTDKIPRGLPMVLMFNTDEDLAYRLTVNGQEPAKPIVSAGGNVGALDADSEIIVTAHQPTHVSVRLVDENGVSVSGRVSGYYLDLPQPYSLEFVGSQPRISEESLTFWRRMEENGFALNGPVFHFGFKEKNDGLFRSVGMEPDKKTMIIAFDRDGRTGYVNTQGKAGEEQHFTITLKKAPEHLPPQVIEMGVIEKKAGTQKNDTKRR